MSQRTYRILFHKCRLPSSPCTLHPQASFRRNVIRRILNRHASQASSQQVPASKNVQRFRWTSVAVSYLIAVWSNTDGIIDRSKFIGADSHRDADSPRSIMSLADVPPLSHNISSDNLSEARTEFVTLLGEEGVNDKKGDLIAHSSTDWSEAPNPSDHAALIVYPNSTEQVSQIARICHSRRIPMTAFAGGTSLEGALAATHGGICVDFRNMNKILALHERDMDVVVQPGLDWQMLNSYLDQYRLFFPVDPGPGACIGGMVATGCSGTNAYRYGTMKDWVISLTVVLADGTVIKTRGRPRKSSAGYDLTRLMVGASGSLGLITEAVLKVTSRPENVCVAVAAFPDMQSAVNTAVKLVQTEVTVAAMEVLDEVFINAVNGSGYGDRKWAEMPTIFFKFSGSTKAIVKDQISQVRKVATEAGSLAFDIGETQDEVDALWGARKTALWSFLALKDNPDDQFVSSDVAVPISRLGDIIEQTKKRLELSGLKSATLGHIGDGNFHSAILFSKQDKDTAEGIIGEIQRLGISMEGTVSGEHGIGLTFRDALEDELGSDTVATMRRIKMALDPLGLLNYGKIFRMQPKDEDPYLTTTDAPSQVVTHAQA